LDFFAVVFNRFIGDKKDRAQRCELLMIANAGGEHGVTVWSSLLKLLNPMKNKTAN